MLTPTNDVINIVREILYLHYLTTQLYVNAKASHNPQYTH